MVLLRDCGLKHPTNPSISTALRPVLPPPFKSIQATAPSSPLACPPPHAVHTNTPSASDNFHPASFVPRPTPVCPASVFQPPAPATAFSQLLQHLRQHLRVGCSRGLDLGLPSCASRFRPACPPAPYPRPPVVSSPCAPGGSMGFVARCPPSHTSTLSQPLTSRLLFTAASFLPPPPKSSVHARTDTRTIS